MAAWVILSCNSPYGIFCWLFTSAFLYTQGRIRRYTPSQDNSSQYWEGYHYIGPNQVSYLSVVTLRGSLSPSIVFTDLLSLLSLIWVVPVQTRPWAIWKLDAIPQGRWVWCAVMLMNFLLFTTVSGSFYSNNLYAIILLLRSPWMLHYEARSA